jgi:leader peptidase (prepilin peptidase)/N-methyltransferase
MWQDNVTLGVFSLPLWQFTLLSSVMFGLITLIGTRKSLRDCKLEVGYWPLMFGVAGVLLSAAFVVSVLGSESQHTPVVLPSEVGRNYRVLYHLILISLLLMITATDVKNYDVLEWTCWLGMLIGIGGAFASGEFQLVHIWVNWNQEQPQLTGAYIPKWLDDHRHLHGLAWSTVGLVTGVVTAWLTQKVSSFVLRIPTLGTGDIFLMAMIGAFLGWQPTLIAFALAPLFALLFGGGIRVVSNRPALPYGPFLAAGALTVLFTWKRIWMLEVPLTLAPNPDRDSIFALRRFFGDWVTLLMTAGLSIGLFVGLLCLLRFYKSLDLKN